MELNQLAPRSAQPADGEAACGRSRKAVLLINLGTPQAPTAAAVRRYLSQFLSDPTVIQLPRGWRWFNRPLGALIAFLRAPRSAKMYQKVWTPEGSPLLTISRAQAEALEESLPSGWRVFVGMRYGEPSIPDALREIEEAGFEQLTIVPMYPQFSGPTTGTALDEVHKYLQGAMHTLHVTTRTTWYGDHRYIAAQSGLLASYARSAGLGPENCYLLFSTHGLPAAYVRRGDPYPGHVARTVSLVMEQLGWPSDRASLAYQSRFGPAKWLDPYTDVVLQNLAKAGEKKVLVCPVSFTADCLETLEEIDVRYRELLEERGTELYLCPALNADPGFISALKHLVLQGVTPMSGAGRHPAASETYSPAARPSDRGSAVSAPDRFGDRRAGVVQADGHEFTMIGVSVNGALDHESPVRHVDAATLLRVKRPACEIPNVLRELSVEVAEAWIRNTCRRFELYCWLPQATGEEGRSRLERIRSSLFPDSASLNGEVNILSGDAARRRLLRTAAGLESHLPGERDVLEQLHAAYRLAERAGTLGRRSQALLEEVTSAEQSLRDSTEWGRFRVDYCQVVLQRAAAESGVDFAAARIVVLGGSTTSAGVLRTLREEFSVRDRQLTLLHRGHKHGGHLKLLRSAIGAGRRIRVQNYQERAVGQAVAEAEVAIFGVDSQEPVLDRASLATLCAGRAKPLLIIDMNVFGSTVGCEDLPEARLYSAAVLDRWAAEHGAEMCRNRAFRAAADEAERWIAERFNASVRRCGGARPVHRIRDHHEACACADSTAPERERALAPTGPGGGRP